MIIGIDGPAASGKSTVSRLVAEKLGYVYVDSGSLYRGMTWKAVREGVDVKNTDDMIQLRDRSNWEFFVENRVVRFTIDGEDPGSQIRSEAVRERVSDVAAIPEIREFIVSQLRDTARFGDLVMEGRDIGSVVFPEAQFKYYLDADPEERARRRHQELVSREEESDVNKVLNSLQRRDAKDSGRKTAPLQIPLGAEVINSTRMSIDEVVAHIVSEVVAKRN
ncbi:MAG: (d)CMP kinase [Verrucomicrobia bacterium]|nr:(d)CMP kinase [Verrucomicrobiota bacterium]